MSTNYAACPKCGAQNAELVKYSWWGGVIGPKMLTHVKCQSCRKKFNGKTGQDNTTGIIIYSVIVGVLAFFLMFAVFFLMRTI
jgi:hypothetical protein